jgi:signal transduction histidine kinase/CheY-like chemotaxis protein
MTDLPKLPALESPRLMSLVTAAGVVLLLLAGAFMVTHNERSYKETKTQQVDAQAAILASTVSAALVFNDQKAAQEYVDALEVDPEINKVAVYDANGSLFVGFSRNRDEPFPARVNIGEHQVDNDRLAVAIPVKQGAATVGAVYLQTIIEPLSRRLERYGVIAMFVVMATIIFLVLALTQHTLTRANARLKQQGLELARANEELRTQIDERAKVETALRQSQKMDAIGQLTGGIAHDFNNLLQIIIGNLEILQRRDLIVHEEGQRMLASAARGAERAATLTSRLLAFSRRQPLNPKPIDVNKLVTNMSEMLRRTLGEAIRIETVLGGGIWRVAVDVNQLENALLNLCVNARDAMSSGGMLTIETANSFLDEAYATTHGVKQGQYVMIAVSDTGSGMTRDVLVKAFEPFFTTKDIGKGSGLGLSQVYGFTSQSGGHAKIYSEVGEGTTVKLYLPRLQSSELSADTVSTPQTVPRGRADQHILVVEDDEDVRIHALASLRELGYTVTEAADGPAALKILDARNDIALLFTDVGLPGGMNGRQLADEVRRRHPALPVLFTTGYARNAIVHQGRLDPGVELITKPFTFAELATRVHRIIEANQVRDPAGESRG